VTDLNLLKTIPEKAPETQHEPHEPVNVQSFFNKFKTSLSEPNNHTSIFATAIDEEKDNPFSFSSHKLEQKKSKINISYWIFGFILVLTLGCCIFFLNSLYKSNNKPLETNDYSVTEQKSPQIAESNIVLAKPQIDSTDSNLQKIQNRLNEVNYLIESKQYTQGFDEAQKITALFNKKFQDSLDKNVSILKIQHYNTFSEIYYRLNDPQKGVIYSDKALKQALKIYDKQSLEIAKQYDLLAFHLDNTGNFDKALQYRYDALQIRLSINNKHKDIGTLITDMNNLGEEYRTLGYFKQSQEILIQAINIVEKKYGIDAPELIIILNNLGLTHQENDNRIIGLAFLQQAYLMAYKHYGKDHNLSVLIAKNITRLKSFKQK